MNQTNEKEQRRKPFKDLGHLSTSNTGSLFAGTKILMLEVML
jgi:hypothetical protein